MIWCISLIILVMILVILFAPLLRFLITRMRLNIPFVELKFPYIFGNITGEKHLALDFNDFYKKYRGHPLIGLYMLCLKPSIMIVEPKLIKMILIKNFDHFQNRGMYYNPRDPLSMILGTLDHDKWQPLRKKLTPAFSPVKIKNMFAVMKIVGDELVDGLMQKICTDSQVEIRDLFAQFTIDVIGKVTIGIHCDTLNSGGTAQLYEMAKKAMEPYLKFPLNVLVITFPNVARFLNIRKHHKEVSDFFVDIIKQTIRYRNEHPEESKSRNDYMKMLLDAELTVNEIAALAFDLLSAGYADSTSTLSYCLYELSLPQNKHIQDKARAEISSVLQNHNGQLTYDALKDMVYCDQIIHETLRKHPVAGNARRIATKSFYVPEAGFKIPEGCSVFIPIYAIHHDAKYWEEPNSFIPERFTDKSRKKDSEIYLPFGLGPRQCIGFRFAKLLIGIGLVSLLKNFAFSTCQRTQIPIEYSSTKNTLIPNSGVWLDVQRI